MIDSLKPASAAALPCKIGYNTVSVSDNLHFALRTLPSFADHLGQ